MTESTRPIPPAARQLIDELHLTPHPCEGGYFLETYRSPERIVVDGRSRSAATAIYFLVLAGYPTELHRLPGPEMFHYYMGDPLELFIADRTGTVSVQSLGPALHAEMRPQVLVPGGHWQAARVRPKGSFSLVGTTMSPGFDYADYQAMSREEWAEKYSHGARAMWDFFEAR